MRPGCGNGLTQEKLSETPPLKIIDETEIDNLGSLRQSGQVEFDKSSGTAFCIENVDFSRICMNYGCNFRIRLNTAHHPVMLTPDLFIEVAVVMDRHGTRAHHSEADTRRHRHLNYLTGRHFQVGDAGGQFSGHAYSASPVTTGVSCRLPHSLQEPSYRRLSL